jgi:Uma2 family endonuclease
MTALKKLTYLTEQDYLAFEMAANVRHEYIDGHLYAMAGASERHNRISLNIGFHLRAAARGGLCGVFMSDMKVRIPQQRAFYYPDVVLVCNQEDNEEYYKKQPCFIAEVASTSTAKIDSREKLVAYQQIPSLRYYLLISTNKKHIKYFIRNEQNEWQTALLEENEILNVDCDNYHAVLTLNDIYEDVAF